MNIESTIQRPQKKHFFSIGSRVNRIQFLGLTFLWFCLSMVSMCVFVSADWANVYFYLALIFIIFTLAKIIMLKIRRLHDMDLSAWWLLLSLIIPIGIIFLFAFLLYPGTKGDNSFGCQPSRASKRYYLMICLPFILWILCQLPSILFLDKSEMEVFNLVSEDS